MSQYHHRILIKLCVINSAFLLQSIHFPSTSSATLISNISKMITLSTKMKRKTWKHRGVWLSIQIWKRWHKVIKQMRPHIPVYGFQKREMRQGAIWVCWNVQTNGHKIFLICCLIMTGLWSVQYVCMLARGQQAATCRGSQHRSDPSLEPQTRATFPRPYFFFSLTSICIISQRLAFHMT